MPSIFRKKAPSLADYHKKIAEEAIQYANQYILTGSTRFVTDNAPTVSDVAADASARSFISKKQIMDKMTTSVRKMCFIHHRFTPQELRLERREDIFSFFEIIKKIKKYSIGNCYELTLLALEYVLYHYPDVHVDAHEIANGDHMFLVIGHDIDVYQKDISNREYFDNVNPAAYICDPWAKTAFLAKDYKTTLRNFVGMEENPRSICKESLTSLLNDDQFVCPSHALGFLSTKKFKKECNASETHQRLQTVFLNKIDCIQLALEKCKDPTHSELLDLLVTEMAVVKEKSHLFLQDVHNYQTLHRMLQTELYNVLQKIKKIIPEDNYLELKTELGTLHLQKMDLSPQFRGYVKLGR